MTATWVALIAHSRILSNWWYVPCSLYQTCLVHMVLSQTCESGDNQVNIWARTSVLVLGQHSSQSRWLNRARTVWGGCPSWKVSQISGFLIMVRSHLAHLVAKECIKFSDELWKPYSLQFAWTWDTCATCLRTPSTFCSSDLKPPWYSRPSS